MAKLQRKKKGYTIEDGLSQTLLGGWCNCRRWARHMLDGWRRGAFKREVEFGSMFHGLLEAWHRHGGHNLDPEKVFRGFAQNWLRDAQAAGDEAQAVELDIGMAEALWDGYLDRWEKDDAKKQWLAVEGVFDVRWRGYRLRGKVDGLYGLGRRNYLLETKTMGRIDQEALGLCLRFDWQLLFYLTALEILTGKRIRGALYNVVRRPQLDRGKDEAVGEFLKRLRQDVAKRPEWYFIRYELPFDDAQVAAGQAELEAKLQEFDRWLRGDVETYCNQSACRGRWNCDYLELCATGATDKYTQKGKLFSELEEGQA